LFTVAAAASARKGRYDKAAVDAMTHQQLVMRTMAQADAALTPLVTNDI
jgi:hypothetical protein